MDIDVHGFFSFQEGFPTLRSYANYITDIDLWEAENRKKGGGRSGTNVRNRFYYELELELVQSHMTQEPVLRGEVGACRFTQLTSTAKR